MAGLRKISGRGGRGPSGAGRTKSNVGQGLEQALDAVAFFPDAALLEKVHAFKTLQDITLYDETARALETFVLGHGGK